jgi:hypothetical protein
MLHHCMWARMKVCEFFEREELVESVLAAVHKEDDEDDEEKDDEDEEDDEDDDDGIPRLKPVFVRK